MNDPTSDGSAPAGGPVAPPVGPAAPSAGGPSVLSGGGAKMGKNEFLKPLVAQMTHQDPLTPADGQQMAAQMAQFTTVEQLQNANDTLAQIRDAFRSQQKAAAAA